MIVPIEYPAIKESFEQGSAGEKDKSKYIGAYKNTATSD